MAMTANKSFNKLKNRTESLTQAPSHVCKTQIGQACLVYFLAIIKVNFHEAKMHSFVFKVYLGPSFCLVDHRVAFARNKSFWLLNK